MFTIPQGELSNGVNMIFLFILFTTTYNWSLDSCLAYAKIHSPLLQEAKWNVRLAEYDSRKNSWFFRYMPNVSLSLGSGFRPLEIEGNTIYVAGERPWQTVVSGVHLTWTFDRILGSGLSDDRISRLKCEQAEYNLSRIYREIRARIREAYSHYNALFKKKKALQTEIEVYKDKLKIQEIYYKRGKTTRDKFLEARVQLEEAKIRLYETEHQAIIARLKLEQLTGVK